MYKTLIVIFFFIMTLALAFIAKLTYISDPKWVAAYIPSSYKNHEVINLISDIDARLVRGTEVENIYILYAESGNLRRNLHEKGIWITLDPVVLKGCGLTGDWLGPKG